MALAAAQRSRWFASGSWSPVHAVLTLVLVASWAWLYRHIFPYLLMVFTREDFRTNQLVIFGAICLVVWRSRDGVALPSFRPRLSPSALGIALGGSVLYLLAARYLDVNAVSAALFGAATYGLIGLYLPAWRWRRGLPAALLIVFALPFGDHLQTFVGYPVRLLTAMVVRGALEATGAAGFNVETILVLENGVAQVDSPCSGVRSLWTGALLLLAATWIGNRPLGRRFVVAAIATSLLLLASNIARVGVLAYLAGVLGGGWKIVAEMVHVPLGALGFAIAGAVGIWLLQRAAPYRDDTTVSTRSNPLNEVSGAVGSRSASCRPDIDQLTVVYRARPTVSRRVADARQFWLAPSVALVALGLSAFYAPAPQRAQLLPMIWRLPSGIQAIERPLDAEALTWLRRDGADSAGRWSFSYGSLAGQLLLVSSEDWRAQHLPERCLEVQGLSLEGSRAQLVADDFALRLVAIGGPRGAPNDARTAAYWFQSPSRVTDDWATRLWDSLAGSREQWVLVTVLFDDAVDPRSADAVSFFSSLRDGIAASLSGSSPHSEISPRYDDRAFELPSRVLLAASPLVKSGIAENRLEKPVLSRPESTVYRSLADSAPLSAIPSRTPSGR